MRVASARIRRQDEQPSQRLPQNAATTMAVSNVDCTCTSASQLLSGVAGRHSPTPAFTQFVLHHQGDILIDTLMATVNCLPAECISSILSFLPVKDLLLHVCLVCKLWEQALQHPICWASIELKQTDLNASLNTLKSHLPIMFGPRSCVNALELQQTGPPTTSCEGLSADLANDLSAMSELQRVSLTHLHNFTGGLRLAWPNLINLAVGGECPCICNVSGAKHRLDLSSCPSLQRLIVDCQGVWFSIVVRGLDYLSDLFVAGDRLTEIEGLFSLSSLTKFRLHWCPHLNTSPAEQGPDPYYDIICAGMPKLVKLDLYGANIEFANVFPRNAAHMPNVEYLKITGGNLLPDLTYLASWSSLTCLEFEENCNDQFTEEDMQAICAVSSLRHLKYSRISCGADFPLHALCKTPSCTIESLSFSFCCDMAGTALESLHVLSSLKHLYLSNCRNASLPSSLALCNSLESVSMSGFLSDHFLSLPNAQVIASIPHLKRADLIPPISEQCVQAIAQSRSLEHLGFYFLHTIPDSWLTHLPPALKPEAIYEII